MIADVVDEDDAEEAEGALVEGDGEVVDDGREQAEGKAWHEVQNSYYAHVA
jgi:uncharacterized protein YjbJ (UPF0337 family)